MIVEMRTYTTLCGRTAEFVDLYRSEGLSIQEPVQGRLLGLYVHEFGPMEQVVLMWAYADEADRAERRDRLIAMPEWRALLPRMAALVVSHETRLLSPRAGEITATP
ncbi:MAG: NIPSNAP family protein [Rhodobacteraceae bacterium]|nr:NIPSNAP family protein [Paracoccaceae bacterium]